MPSPNVVRNFSKDSIYHVFNRGVEKRNIFIDEQDYRIFLYYLFIYLNPLKEVVSKYPFFPIRLYNKNLSSEIELLSFTLMPNHFHLLLRQKSINGISKLIKQLTNAYTEYFNKKYKRVGGLVQGRFKAISLTTDELLLHISRYIHLNPLVANLISDLRDYKWSSYLDFLGQSNEIKIAKHYILDHFSDPKLYEKFVLDQADYAKGLAKLKHLTLEN